MAIVAAPVAWRTRLMCNVFPGKHGFETAAAAPHDGTGGRRGEGERGGTSVDLYAAVARLLIHIFHRLYKHTGKRPIYNDIFSSMLNDQKQIDLYSGQQIQPSDDSLFSCFDKNKVKKPIFP